MSISGRRSGRKGAPVILNNCYRTSVHSDCEKVHRDPTSKVIVLIDDTNVNIGGQRAAGIDFNIAYHVRAKPIGTLRLSVGGIWLTRFEATEPGDIVVSGLGKL